MKRLQIARLRRQFGLTEAQAKTVALLHFGGRKNG